RRHRVVLLRVLRGMGHRDRRRRRRLPRTVRRRIPLDQRRGRGCGARARHRTVRRLAPEEERTMSDLVIEVRDLSFRYPGAARDTLRNVNLTIERGDFVAIVGGNGSGKTTLCKTFNGLVPHYWSGEFAGAVEVSGQDSWDSSVARLSW